MTNNADHVSEQYSLRASNPMPTNSGFVLHTFMVEKYVTFFYLATDRLPISEEFRGQKGTGGYTSAQFSRLADRTGTMFQGRIVGDVEYVDEDEISGNSGGYL